MAHGGHESVELVAALILVAGGGLFTLLALRGMARRRSSTVAAPAVTPAPPLQRSVALILAGLSAGAAAIHLVAAPSHYVELGDLGAGFLVSAAFQAAWVRWCLAGPTRRTALIGIAGNLGILAAWLYTRTVGLPIGPFAGGPEPIGFPDGASVVFEVLLVVGLTLLAVERRPAVGRRIGATARAVGRELGSIALVPVLSLVLVITTLATVAIATGLDHGTGGHPDAAHVASH